MWQGYYLNQVLQFFSQGFNQSDIVSQAGDISNAETTELRLRESAGLDFCVWGISLTVPLSVALQMSWREATQQSGGTTVTLRTHDKGLHLNSKSRDVEDMENILKTKLEGMVTD